MELESLLMAGDTDSGETGGQIEGHSLLWALPGSRLERELGSAVCGVLSQVSQSREGRVALEWSRP